jgi:hypothetical protein
MPTRQRHPISSPGLSGAGTGLGEALICLRLATVYRASQMCCHSSDGARRRRRDTVTGAFFRNRGDIMPTPLFAAGPIVIVAIGIPILIAMKAQPIGALPYRWGLYVGIETAVLAAFLTVGTVSALTKGANLSAVVGCTWVLCAIVGAVGVLKRKRWGTIFALLAYVQLMVWPPLFNRLQGVPASQAAGPGLMSLVFILCNISYFRKRWASMSGGVV